MLSGNSCPAPSIADRCDRNIRYHVGDNHVEGRLTDARHAWRLPAFLRTARNCQPESETLDQRPTTGQKRGPLRPRAGRSLPGPEIFQRSPGTQAACRRRALVMVNAAPLRVIALMARAE